jgi:DNA-binding response OmpR family regulator
MKQVLYIEEDKDSADTVKILLKSRDIEVDVAPSREKGVEYAKKKSYDLTLLDLNSNDKQGWDTFNSLKRIKDSRIAITSVFPFFNSSALKRGGVVDYIIKPFDEKGFADRIAQIIS